MMEFLSTHVGEQWIPIPAQKTQPNLGKKIIVVDRNFDEHITR